MRDFWHATFLGFVIALGLLTALTVLFPPTVPPVAAQDITTELAFFLRNLRNMQAATTVTVDAATTFAVTGPYSARITLACTGAETIDTITGGTAGMVLYIQHTDTDCTLADDETPTAADAIDLTAAATDVGAAKKVVVLIYNAGAWEEVAESDN